MPSIGGAQSSEDHPGTDDDIPIRKFEELALPSSSSGPPKLSVPSQHENDIATLSTSTTTRGAATGDGIVNDKELPPASKLRLYLMVCGDFGLSFTWLCKFAVAT